MIGQQGAVWFPNPNFTRGWRRGKPHYIIIHGTAGNADEPALHSAQYVLSRRESTHYTVDSIGTIVQTVDEANAAWGNGVISGPAGVAVQGDSNGPHDAFWDSTGGDPNDDTISIETCRDVTNTSPWSPIQELTIYKLVAGICQRWGIPPQMANINGGITGHFSIDPRNRAYCPGPVDWESLITAAGGSGLYAPGVQFPMSATLPGLAPAAPMTGFSQAPISITSFNDAFLQTSSNVHETLVHAPGFYGVCAALDEAEQYPGIYNAFAGDTNPSDVPSNAWESIAGTIAGNTTAFMTRSFFVMLGVLLLIGLLWNITSPMLSGGGDIAGKVLS